ncbi:MAG TPA: isocitrate/isopropylmalate dehydrogenase family protein [Methanospirillum sp.]|uniref:isocitrate/isopropylmalate dehydrogenase family protein n=1 Tax=Methanospirillum sp. TaxID=45200 RepID=UPI002C387DA5|nr:isocitrate/isopropylmalate dehydrogenase family protein [Methanospirillum sp.]HWQ63069.1 isocitrate/isopropylmalate dehydrogenase family protein [Methanospirillum sp.]
MKVVVAPGDGIGPEVIAPAVDVLKIFHPEWEYSQVYLGYECWKRTGDPLSQTTRSALKEADLILFGAITTPPDPAYKSVILTIRKELDLYANLRPVFGAGFDILIVRENTEGLYSGIEWQEKDRACTIRLVTEEGSRRIARFASSCARRRRRHLTIGNKANILKSDVFFVRICQEEAEKIGVSVDKKYIDALVLDVLQHPERYDVIVTTNIFGDILSDAAAYLEGGLGMLPSANIGKDHALFEPVHGSAPDIAGKGIANPIAAIRCISLLLKYAQERENAKIVEAAIQKVLADGVKTPDLGGKAGTKEVGEAVIKEIIRIREIPEPDL